MVKILTLDPGETTGACYLEPTNQMDIKIHDIVQLEGREKLIAWLEKFKRPIDLVLIEDYEMVPKFMKMNMGRKKGKMETLRVIGAIEAWCIRNEIKYRLVSPRDNRMNVKKSGMDPYAHNHAHTHWAFAYNHAFKYLADRKLVKTALQKSMEK